MGAVTGAIGLAAASHYASLGLTLSHYDAKAHLVVSRRILDSLTPGWEQIGAVWLPVPHLVNMLPVQVDVFYRTGLFAVGISMLAHALAAWSLASVVLALTSSRAGALLAAALYALNPNVLYLQSTPMTEPLLFGLTALQVLLVTRWVLHPGTSAGMAASTRARADAHHAGPMAAGEQLTVSSSIGWIMVLSCLTRYEAWPITGACFVTSALASWRRGHAAADVLRVHARLALYPAAAVLGFLVFSRVTVGEWFVSSGFFVPDETLRGQPAIVLETIAEGLGQLTGSWVLGLSAITTLVIATLGLASAGRSPMLIPLSLWASAALPIAAYLAGHPFRMRYEIPLVLASAVTAGLAIGLLRRVAPAVAMAIMVGVLVEVPPFDPAAPMIVEAQRDTNIRARAGVTACLTSQYRGGTVMISMGALAHYMHELAAAGFDLRDFLHEGNGPLWDSAYTRGPAALVEWVLVDEAAEGGDAIFQRHRQLPRLLDEYDAVCRGAGVAVYRRRAR